MRLYIAGPMSDQPAWNVPAFKAAAARLRDLGHEVTDPSEHFGGDTSLPWEVYLSESLREIPYTEAVAVLPGWEGSRGARLEIFVARSLGLPVLDADTLAPVEGTGSVCLDAYLLVHGDRADSYGDPRPMYATVGQIWSAILGDSEPIPSTTTLLMMAGMKIGRYSERPSRDSLVDAAGYCELVERAR